MAIRVRSNTHLHGRERRGAVASLSCQRMPCSAARSMAAIRRASDDMKPSGFAANLARVLTEMGLGMSLSSFHADAESKSGANGHCAGSSPPDHWYAER